MLYFFGLPYVGIEFSRINRKNFLNLPQLMLETSHLVEVCLLLCEIYRLFK
jgi:hypothetical protein